MPWTEARRYCKTFHTDLASVRNQTENEKVFGLTGGSASWIGLYRSRLWSDKQEYMYENWRPSTPYVPAQPDNGLYVYLESGFQHCTAVSLADFGQWTDENCLSTFPFICYKSEFT